VNCLISCEPGKDLSQVLPEDVSDPDWNHSWFVAEIAEPA